MSISNDESNVMVIGCPHVNVTALVSMALSGNCDDVSTRMRKANTMFTMMCHCKKD